MITLNNSSLEQVKNIDVVFDNLCGVNYTDYNSDILKNRLSNDCIAFIIANQPDGLMPLIQKYESMGLKFNSILIYSKKLSMVKSYKKSKVFVYVFTKGNARCVNSNIYGTTRVPVLTQSEIYEDLIVKNVKQNTTMVDFNVLTDMKANICSKHNIDYIGCVSDEKLFKKLQYFFNF